MHCVFPEFGPHAFNVGGGATTELPDASFSHLSFIGLGVGVCAWGQDGVQNGMQGGFGVTTGVGVGPGVVFTLKYPISNPIHRSTRGIEKIPQATNSASF
jgi:hypothetical protein